MSASENRAPRLSGLSKAVLLAWMGTVACVFFALYAPDMPVATLLPEFVFRVRAVLLPWFFAAPVLQ